MWPYIHKHWKLGAIGAAGMVLLSLLSLPAPYLTKIVIDQAIGGKNYQLLNSLILALFSVQALLSGASWVTNYSFNKFSLEIMTRIKKDLFHRILRFPMSFFAGHETGYLMSRVGEVEGLNLFFSSTLVYVVVSLARFAFCLGVLIHLNAEMTGLALLVLPPFFGITRWFRRDLRKLSWEFYEKSAQLSQGMQDSLSGIEAVKSFGAETREAAKFQLHLDGLKTMNVRRTVLMSLYSESISFLGAGAGFVILWLSGWKIISGTFTLGSYIAFAAYFAQLLGPTQMMANLGLTLQPAKVALQRIRELMKVDAEDESGPSTAIPSIQGRIELRDVDFEYEAGKPVFSKANLEIRPGEKILIAGPNGSGKSTLIKLIMGFYRPQRGEILMDGKPLYEISKASLREKISIVSQNTFLFSDTVRNNVLYSAPDAAGSDLDEAIRLSGAMDFVRELPQGLDTEIGERGIRLSGGERQKLSIARAILRRSDLIIYDEATTHLDEASVMLLRELMQTRFADKTCLVVSHRPIEIPAIDRVIRIVRGNLRESNPL
jgi:ABC-type bacteriocin/lantibiotic exporter with double-glycine peptidase domain